MGKDLQGNELGRGISQRKEDGLYVARIRKNGIKPIVVSSLDLDILIKKLDKIKSETPECLCQHIPQIMLNEKQGEVCVNNGGYVYFISDGFYIKIGVASNIQHRIKMLQTGNPNILKLIHSEYSKFPYDLEKKYHNKYRKYHVRGEWYDIIDILKFE